MTDRVWLSGFVLLWLGSYGWDIGGLIEQEVQGYRVEASLLDVGVLQVLSSLFVLAASGLKSTNAGSLSVLAFPALWFGAAIKLIVVLVRGTDEDSPNAALRIVALCVPLVFAPAACIGLLWSRLLARESLAALFRLGYAVAIVCGAAVFTVLGLVMGESALTGGAVGSPSANVWFAAVLPTALWLLTMATVGWIEGLCTAVLLLARGGEWGRAGYSGAHELGLVAGGETLPAFLGGAKLLQAILMFVCAHAASFPGWPAVEDLETLEGWRWLAGRVGAAGIPAALLLATVVVLFVLGATRNPERFTSSALARCMVRVCRVFDWVGPIRSLDWVSLAVGCCRAPSEPPSPNK